MINYKTVIGVGQTGSRLATEYAGKKDILLTFNTDHRDSVGVNKAHDKLITNGGAGQNYASGLKIWASNRDELEKYLEPVENQDVVYFVSGGGGCFIPENKVLMADKTEKEIGSIKVGDKVITKDGTIETVEKVWEFDKTNEELYEFILDNGKSFTCTGDHKILTSIDGEKKYIEAKNLTENNELISIKELIKQYENNNNLDYLVGVSDENKSN